MQVSNNNRSLGFSALTIDPQIWKKADKQLKRAVVEALPELEKHSKHCDINIRLHHDNYLQIDVARTKFLEAKRKFFKQFIRGEGNVYSDYQPGKENIIASFKQALTDCRSDIKAKFEKRFGTKDDRSLKDPEKYLAKLAKKSEYLEKTKQKQEVASRIEGPGEFIEDQGRVYKKYVKK